MNYLKAVLKKDNETKVTELKKIISLGKQLGKDTRPDEKKLEIILKRNQVKTTNTTTSNNSSKVDSTKYSISSVFTQDNKIIVDFNKNITREFIKFFELETNALHKDVYDLKGNFKDAKPTKLAIKGVDRIYIGQNQPYVLRIVIANKTNLKTSYSYNKKRLTISIDSIKSTDSEIGTKIEKQPEIKKVEKQEIEIEKPSNNFVDTKNFIRSINTDENKIIVKFNKNFTRNHLRYSAYKHRNSYNDVFDITGKFAHAKPIKLAMNGLDKISIGQIGEKLRIRLINKKDIKVIYQIKKRELIIKVLGLDNSTSKSTKPALPYANFRSRTIVIDAGHGAKDVGAVGPNKRYEKVVTLKVSKYLYSMLKQRGHKVYLTRHTDKFIKVNNRTILANKKNADIFISIHANSVPKSKAHKIQGIETFFLSPARSERAKRVAAKENKSDVRRMSDSTKAAFLESLNRPRITASHKLAIDIQAGMLQSVRKQYNGVKDSGVREGPFWVLVGAQMPSVLVELGYMSHPTESARLYSSKYQKLLANGLANGIDSYFSKNP